MSEKHTEHVFTAVDAQDNPRACIRVLDTLRREPFYATYKARLLELVGVRPEGRYLDVGAGTGDDARATAMATGAVVVALDQSHTMMQEAVNRGLMNAVVGSAESLPFQDKAFDGCWADRTLQHLVDPARALREMLRVTRPGGRVVAVDPDYDTQVMEFPDQELARRVLRFRRDLGLRHGALAHRIPAMFAEVGLADAQTEARTLVVRDPTAVDNVIGLRTWARSAQPGGYLSEEDVRTWETLFDQTVAAGRFLYAVTFFLTVGTKGRTCGP